MTEFYNPPKPIESQDEWASLSDSAQIAHTAKHLGVKFPNVISDPNSQAVKDFKTRRELEIADRQIARMRARHGHNTDTDPADKIPEFQPPEGITPLQILQSHDAVMAAETYTDGLSALQSATGEIEITEDEEGNKSSNFIQKTTLNDALRFDMLANLRMLQSKMITEQLAQDPAIYEDSPAVFHGQLLLSFNKYLDALGVADEFNALHPDSQNEILNLAESAFLKSPDEAKTAFMWANWTESEPLAQTKGNFDKEQARIFSEVNAIEIHEEARRVAHGEKDFNDVERLTAEEKQL